jgi:hypothetical protein
MNNRHKIIKNIVTETLIREELVDEAVGAYLFNVAKKGISGAKRYAKSELKGRIKHGVQMALDYGMVYGMGGNAPVVGEYSGPQSQKL